MRVLVASVDSDIGAAIASKHRELGHEVSATSHNGKPQTINLELAHPFTWPKLVPGSVDRLYYTIGIGDGRATRNEVMQINAFLSCDFLNMAAAAIVDDGQIVVLSSGWGSISSVASVRAPYYRMSKAALNMGVAIAAHRHTRIRWTLMHPGLVKTKMTRWMRTGEQALTPEESAAGVIASATAHAHRPFCFVDYQGQTVPF